MTLANTYWAHGMLSKIVLSKYACIQYLDVTVEVQSRLMFYLATLNSIIQGPGYPKAYLPKGALLDLAVGFSEMFGRWLGGV